MPGRYRRSSFAGNRSARRKLVWATQAGGTTLATSGANFNADLIMNLKVAGSSVLGATVMRTHFRWSVAWGATQVQTSQVAVGLVVQSTNLIPTNTVDLLQDEDWAYRDSFLMGTGVNYFPTGAAGASEGFTLDLRAKRKVQELNQTWVLAMSLQNGVAAVPISYYCRTLLALP